MKKLFYIVAIVIPLFLSANISTISSIKELNYPWNDKCWFLVDLDNCLFESKGALGHADWFYDLVEKRMDLGMTKEEAVMDAYPLWIKVQKITEVQPLELDFVDLIKELQSQGITVMGLTHRQPSVALETACQVRSLDLDFTISAPKSISPIAIDINGPALFHEGILFVGDYNKKSAVLSDFFTQIGHSPSQVVFIDDKKKNVEELEESLCQLGIDYQGLHYTFITSKPPIYNDEEAEKQLSDFLKAR